MKQRTGVGKGVRIGVLRRASDLPNPSDDRGNWDYWEITAAKEKGRGATTAMTGWRSNHAITHECYKNRKPRFENPAGWSVPVSVSIGRHMIDGSSLQEAIKSGCADEEGYRAPVRRGSWLLVLWFNIYIIHIIRPYNMIESNKEPQSFPYPSLHKRILVLAASPLRYRLFRFP